MKLRLAAFLCFLASAQIAWGGADVSREQIGTWLEASAAASATFAPGDILTSADLDRLRPFVPPGQVEEFDFPEFRMEIGATGDYSPHPVYQQATLQYAGQTRLAEDGAMLDYVAGQPFTLEAIDAASPERAGYMGAWNSNRRWQNFGQNVILAYTLFMQERPGAASDFSGFPPNMISGEGHLERHVEAGWRRTYFTHLPQLADTNHRFEFSGAEKVAYKELNEYFEPFEFRDQKLLAERWIDPYEDDTLNAYLPNERKVRRLSAKEKSDTWIGSEITFDDFYGFDGQVLHYTWRYLGRHKVMIVMNTKHAYAHHIGPNSRVADDRWELREAVVIEGVPTLKGHPYGSRMLFLDAQNFMYINGLYFDQAGKLMRGAMPIYSWSEETLDHPEVNRGVRISMYKGYSFVNFQTGNSTVTNILETSYPNAEPKKIRRLYRVDTLTQGR